MPKFNNLFLKGQESCPCLFIVDVWAFMFCYFIILHFMIVVVFEVCVRQFSLKVKCKCLIYCVKDV